MRILGTPYIKIQQQFPIGTSEAKQTDDGLQNKSHTHYIAIFGPHGPAESLSGKKVKKDHLG